MLNLIHIAISFHFIFSLYAQIPLIVSLEQRLVTMYQKKATELINRRRQDVKDQMEELTPSSM